MGIVGPFLALFLGFFAAIYGLVSGSTTVILIGLVVSAVAFVRLVKGFISVGGD